MSDDNDDDGMIGSINSIAGLDDNDYDQPMSATSSSKKSIKEVAQNAIAEAAKEAKKDAKEKKAKKRQHDTLHRVVNIMVIVMLIIGFIGAGVVIYNNVFPKTLPNKDKKLDKKAAAAANLLKAEQPEPGKPVWTQPKQDFAFYGLTEPSVLTPIIPPTTLPEYNIDSLEDAINSAMVDIGWKRTSNGSYEPNEDSSVNFPLLSSQSTLVGALEAGLIRGGDRCPNPDDYYIPAPINRCFASCKPDEDFTVWRTPVEANYKYYCRKRCGISKMDGRIVPMDEKQGFCERRRYTPDFMYDDVAIRLWWRKQEPNASVEQIEQRVNNRDDRERAAADICRGDTSISGYRHIMGRYCYSMGDRADSSPNNFAPLQMNCNVGAAEGYTRTPDGLTCAKCPKGMKPLGVYPYYNCVEECPDGTTDNGMGTAYKCYPNATQALDTGEGKPPSSSPPAQTV